MEVVAQREPLSMGWCLDCHRNPDPHIRPAEEITNMAWEPTVHAVKAGQRDSLAPPTDCTGCHR
jgi:hypothetical protein